MECFVLLRIMSDSLQSNLSEKDRNLLIDTYGKDSRFKNLFKNIFERGTGKKVDNFLREQENFNYDSGFMQEIPGYLDPETGKVIREDQIASTPYNPAGLPDDVYRATQRQYGKKSFGPYTSDDMRLIQQYFGGFRGA